MHVRDKEIIYRTFESKNEVFINNLENNLNRDKSENSSRLFFMINFKFIVF